MQAARIFIITFVMLSAWGCSKETTTETPQEKPEVKNYLVLAWQEFEAGHYDTAAAYFTEAYNRTTVITEQGEALCGRGWANAYKRELAKAKSDFSFALGLSGITSIIRTDAMVGNAFVLYALNDFDGAIVSANSALVNIPAYTFSHDSKVTVKRIRLLLAQSYFAIGQFTQAAEQMNILDPSNAPYPTDPMVLLGKILAVLNSL